MKAHFPSLAVGIGLTSKKRRKKKKSLWDKAHKVTNFKIKSFFSHIYYVIKNWVSEKKTYLKSL